MPLRLYDYAASCNAYKIRLLIAQLALDVERVEVDIFAGGTLDDAFAALNPARTVPVLELPDGRTLPESGAILWHLAEGSPLLPGDGWLRAQVLRWLLWEQADLLPATGGLRFRLQNGRGGGGAPPAPGRPAVRGAAGRGGRGRPGAPPPPRRGRRGARAARRPPA